MMSVTPKRLWMVSYRTVNFRYYVKFHMSGHAKSLGFLTIMEHNSYLSKKLLVK